MLTAPGVGTNVNVKSPPGVWGCPGVGLEIDKCISNIFDRTAKKLLVDARKLDLEIKN